MLKSESIPIKQFSNRRVAVGFRDDIESAIYTGACSIMNAAEGATRWGAGAGFGVGGRKGAFLSINLLKTAGTAAGYFCNTPPVPLPAVNFTGGQCLTEYNVQGTVDRYINGNLAQQDQVYQVGYGLAGPIQSVGYNQRGDKILVIHGGGIQTEIPSGTQAGGTSLQGLRNVLVTRRDGGLDNCGDPTADVEPMSPADREITINVGGDNAQLAVGNGILQVNGDVTAPIRINSPNFDFTGELVLNKGDINLNFGGVDPRVPCVPDEPGTDLPPPDDTEPPPDNPEENGNMIGVIVVTQSIDASAQVTRVPQGDNPDIIVPKLGYVSFRIRVGDTYAWTEDIPIKVERQYVHVPGGVSAVAVAGTPRMGVTWVITPVNGVQPNIEFT